MNDFILSLAVTVGGIFMMDRMDENSANSQQQASCGALSGTWSSVIQEGATTGTCTKAGQPIATAYTMWGAPVDFGVPMAAGILLTRSLPGLLGAVVGAIGMFLLGISEIH
jgi:hypothetical protein